MKALGTGAKQLGRLPPISDPRALMFSRFAVAPRRLPKETHFWPRRASFPIRTFGNTRYGDCTRAKQAIAAMRMERLETRATPRITDEEVVRVYFDMTERLYGGGDTGAYETHALAEWRKPDQTFRDTRGRALTIDAFTRINHNDHEEVRTAIWAAGAHGIAVCFNLPRAFQRLNPPAPWDVPEGQPVTGVWLPGSWGGHSMWARDYDQHGVWVVHTWGLHDQLVTWRAAALYMDEAHLVIDSLDYWRAKKPRARRFIDFDGIRKAVNRVSSHKLP
jgi:hypothetical protein